MILGFMCFSVQEANALVEYGLEQTKKQNDDDNSINYNELFNDFLIAYPTIQQQDIETAYNLTVKGIKISLMIDCVQHIRIIDELCDRIYCNTSSSTTIIPKISVCIDLDMSYRVRCINLRLGAHRSNVYDEYDLNMILDEILSSKFIKLSGVMGYEAGVAGVPDNNPYSSHPNWFIKTMKPIFQNDCNKRRSELVDFINNKIKAINQGTDAGFNTTTDNITKGEENNLSSFTFVNGGGTGNIHLDLKGCTEVTAGSGMIQSKIFDYFINSLCQPAAAFSLQITRISIDEKYVCCQSGGFIASGSTSKDKSPVPFLPRNQVYGPYDDEGFGEVQTPLRVKDASIFNYGDSLFFRYHILFFILYFSVNIVIINLIDYYSGQQRQERLRNILMNIS